MEILITESQLRVILKEEYSEKVISQLLKKFIGYDSTADNRDKIIDHKLVNMVYDFIKTFDKIKNSPNIAKKDIFTYTLPELEEVVLNYMKKDNPKSYKGDSDLDLVYRNDELLIYVGDTKEKCIRYGEGYNFCISSHGKENLYHSYRYERNGTPYFIFNNNLAPSKEVDDADEEDKIFLDPNHLLVLFVHPITNLPDGEFEDFDENGEDVDYGKDIYYTVTNANNRGEKSYLYFDSIVNLYPWLKGLEHLFKMVGLNYREHELSFFPNFYATELRMINRKYVSGTDANGCSNIPPMRYTNYSDFLSFEDDEFFMAYKNKQYKTFTIIGPVMFGNKTENRKLGMYVGPNGKTNAEKRVNIMIKNNKEPENDRYMRRPDIPEEILQKLIDINNYKIIECNWSNDFINYMGELYKLYKSMIHRKWELSQMEDFNI